MTRDDVAFIREVTEAARAAPLLGGRFLVMWGGLLSLAYLGHWGVVSGAFGVSGAWLGVVWGVFAMLGVLGMVVLTPTLRRKPGRNTFGNRVDMAVWNGGGFGLSAFAVTAILGASLGRIPIMVVDMIMPVAFLIYGTAFLASATAAVQPWLRAFAGGAYLGVAGAVWLTGTDEQYLWGALAALLVVFLPGLVLLRREPPALPAEPRPEEIA